MVRGAAESFSIYIVDDDDAVRDSLVALLEPEGFTIRLYASADSFLDDFKSFHPSDAGRVCLLLDLHMPGQGGQELLDILVVRGDGIPVIVMTGNADQKTKTRAMNSGAVAFLEKPFDADQLIEAIRASQR